MSTTEAGRRTASGKPDSINRDGVSLQAVIDAPRRLDELSCARVVCSAAEAVHAAQKGGQPLGTLSPSAIVLLPDGGVKLVAGAAALPYAAPEKLRGGAGDRRTDVFALGVMLWEALAHERLFDGASDDAVKQAVLRGTIRPPSELNANVPAELDAICKRALAREPSERYQSARVMAAEIDAVLSDAGYPESNEPIATYVAALAGAQAIEGQYPSDQSPPAGPPSLGATPPLPPVLPGSSGGTSPPVGTPSPPILPGSSGGTSPPVGAPLPPVLPHSMGGTSPASRTPIRSPDARSAPSSTLPPPVFVPAASPDSPSTPGGLPRARTTGASSPPEMAGSPPAILGSPPASKLTPPESLVASSDTSPSPVGRPRPDRTAILGSPGTGPVEAAPSHVPPSRSQPVTQPLPSVAEPPLKPAARAGAPPGRFAKTEILGSAPLSPEKALPATPFLAPNPAAPAPGSPGSTMIGPTPVPASPSPPAFVVPQSHPIVPSAVGPAAPIAAQPAQQATDPRQGPPVPSKPSSHPHPRIKPSLANAETLPVPQLPAHLAVSPAAPQLEKPPGITVTPSSPPAPLRTVEDGSGSGDGGGERQADPAEVISPHDSDKGSRSAREGRDVLAGWAWTTGSLQAIDENDVDFAAQAERASRRRLIFAIGGALAVVFAIAVVAFAFSGSEPSEQDARATTSLSSATAPRPEPTALPAEPANPGSVPTAEPGTTAPAPSAGTAPAQTQPATESTSNADSSGLPASGTAPSAAPTATADPTKADTAKADTAKAEPTNADVAKADPTRADAAKTEPTKTEPTKAEPTKAEPTKADAAKADPTKVAAASKASEPPKAPPPRVATAAKVATPAESPSAEAPKLSRKPTEPSKPNELAEPPEPRRPARTAKRPPPTDKLAKPVTRAQPEDPYAASSEKPRADPADAYRTGLQRYARGDIQGALATFRSSLSSNPSFAPTWRGLGLVYEKLGDKRQARSAFRRYLQLAPDAGDAEQIRERMERLGS